MKIGVLPPFRAKVDGAEVLVDHRTFTMRERRMSRAALLPLIVEDGLQPDEADQMAALLWVVLHRDDPELSFLDVYDSLDVGSLADAEAGAVDSDDPSQ